MKFSITCAELINQSHGLRQGLLELVNDMGEEDQDEHMSHGNKPPAQGAARAPAAPRIQSCPAAAVPVTFPYNSAPPHPPPGPVPFTCPNQAGPPCAAQDLTGLPMETHLDTEVAYHAVSHANPERQMYHCSFINCCMSRLQLCCADTPLTTFWTQAPLTQLFPVQ